MQATDRSNKGHKNTHTSAHTTSTLRTDKVIAPALRRAGVAVVTGSLVLALCPLSAIAETSSTSSATAEQTTSSAPAAPDGGTPPDGQPGEPPSGGQPGGMAPDGQGGAPGGMGGADTMTYDYTGTLSGVLVADGEAVTSDSESYDATEADQNAALVENGGTLTLTGDTLTKSGDDTNGDNCNFYGLNSILLAVGEGSTATVQNTSLSATSEGSNGIFSTDGATVLANGVTISTTAGNSRGLDATYGGTIVAGKANIQTQGDHCAAVATDRGGGNISVTDSTFSTAGSGSPLLYSTGNIEVSGVTGTSTGSQIAGMEGLNTILISDSTLESTQTDRTASDPVADGIIIYQSTSGDAESTTGETATFQAVNSTLKSAITSGAMFYLTNTSADIVLKGTTLDFDSSAADLLLAAGNDSNNWGTAGSNGATVRLTAIGEQLAGNIEADTISSADVWLTEGTTWSGAASIVENSAGSTSEAPVSVSVDGTSSWVVTANSTVSNLTVADGGRVVDADGNAVTIVADGTTVVEGTSDLTVTVTGTYSTSYDASGAGTVQEATIDRSAYDEAFGEDATGSEATTEQASGQAEDAASTSEQAATSPSPFEAFVAWLRELLGL